MIRRALATGGLLAALVVAPAFAQPPADPPPDPIDELLRAAPLPIEPFTPAVPPPPLPLMPPPRGAEAGPLPLEQTGRSADGPPTESDLAYDNRLRASMAASQGLRGPLDGGWALMAGDRDLYVFELAERNGAVQGAWRDPRRPGVSGFVDAIDRSGEAIVLRFAAAVVTLRGAEGRWSGELREGERVEAVTLRRHGP